MITFALKEPGTRQTEERRKELAKSETLIYLFVNYAGRSLKISTGVKVKPADWNKVAHRARKGVTGGEAINRYLDKLEIRAKELYHEMIADHGRIITERFRDEVSKAIPYRGQRETFLQFCQRYAKESQPGSSTGKIYHTTIEHLKSYRGAKDWEDIDGAWLQRYAGYLEGKGLAKNTVGKNIRYVKLFLNVATEKGINRNLAYKTTRFKNPQEESETIYLSENELLNMYGIEGLPPYIDRARDMFLIASFTGLRYSDFVQITVDNFAGGMIRHRTKKTGEAVIIPVHWTVRQIFEKYQGDLPPAISNQKMNTYIKSVAAGAGIKEPVIKHWTQGGVRTSKTFQKWELVTTHTARRSFATNAYIAGIPTVTIMKITGHRSERSFMKYIKISKYENAVLAASHPFFQEPGI